MSDASKSTEQGTAAGADAPSPVNAGSHERERPPESSPGSPPVTSQPVQSESPPETPRPVQSESPPETPRPAPSERPSDMQQAAQSGRPKAPEKEAPPVRERSRRRPVAGKVKAGTDAVRSKIASVIWLIAVVCALFLAVGALLIALDANPQNSLRDFVISGADLLDGPLSRKDGLFTFDGKDAVTKRALVNWGLAAVVYLVIGKVLDRIIRP